MPPKYRVNITLHAEQDIQEILTYIQHDNPQTALVFVTELERQVISLERFPLRCPVIPETEELGIAYCHMIYDQYRTIFRISGNTVYILRVIHGARLLDLSILTSLG